MSSVGNCDECPRRFSCNSCMDYCGMINRKGLIGKLVDWISERFA